MQDLFNDEAQIMRFLKCVANNYAMKYQVEFDDLLQESYIIYQNAKKTYEGNKAQFSTHLFHELRRLSRFCVKEYRDRIIENELLIIDEMSENPFLTVDDLLNDAKNYLSKFAFEVFSYIVSRKWDDVTTEKSKRKKDGLTVSEAVRKTKWTRYAVEAAYKEIRKYWRIYGVKLYA